MLASGLSSLDSAGHYTLCARSETLKEPAGPRSSGVRLTPAESSESSLLFCCPIEMR